MGMKQAWNALFDGDEPNPKADNIIALQAQYIRQLEEKATTVEQGLVAVRRESSRVVSRPLDIDHDVARSHALSDLLSAPPQHILTALELAGAYIRLDGNTLGRIIDALNGINQVKVRTGLQAEEIMEENGLSASDSDALKLIVAAVYTLLLGLNQGHGLAVASIYLQIRGQYGMKSSRRRPGVTRDHHAEQSTINSSPSGNTSAFDAFSV